MIDIKLTDKTLINLCDENCVDAYVYTLPENYDSSIVREIAQKFYLPLEVALEARGFRGKQESFVVLNTIHDSRAAYLIILGVGAKKDNKLCKENYRRALGRLVRIAEQYKIKNLGLEIPNAQDYGVSNECIARETSTILNKAKYHFDEFITDENRKLNWKTTVYLSVSKHVNDKDNIERGVKQGEIIADSINTARYYCDLPPSVLTPEELADKAKDIVDKSSNLTIEIFDESKIRALGMGGIEAVSRGSQEEAKFVIINYNCGDSNAKTYGIVGKGVTFDSGGLSLKPAVHMEDMKDDMSGAAVVISTMKAVSQLKPKVNVIAFAPLVENMPSGSAVKPGDIIRFYNGKTAEVKNTDAEGRLILADALSYAVKNYKLDALIDLATLTGACPHALGPFYAGLMSRHEDLQNSLLSASKRSGDKLWPLPLDDEYAKAISSHVADMANIGSSIYKAGTVTAGMFLKNFVDEKTPWAHIDIAGVAFGVPDLTYLRPGATGFGIRLLLSIFMNWCE